MTTKRALVTAAILALTPATGTFADSLGVPVGSQADRSQQNLPRNGMTQASVKSAWGQPQAIKGPVGQPPISQWRYGDFVVYFEGNRVIHSVLMRQR